MKYMKLKLHICVRFHKSNANFQVFRPVRTKHKCKCMGKFSVHIEASTEQIQQPIHSTFNFVGLLYTITTDKLLSN